MSPDTTSASSSLPERPLGEISPRDLSSARLAMHYGAQPLAAAAYALLPMQEDHGHSVLLWDASKARLAGRSLPGGGRLFYDPLRLRIGYVQVDGSEGSVFELEGKTLGQVFSSTAEALRAAGHVVPPAGFGLPNYELPAAPVANGETFPAPDAPAFEELVRWYALASAALSRISVALLESREVVLWPHHFDLAALLALPGTDPARFVGVGFSPGDEHYAEPYVYVSPYPGPAPELLPELAAGAHWHLDGFTSAILPGSAIVQAPDLPSQAARVDQHFHQAIVHSLVLLQG